MPDVNPVLRCVLILAVLANCLPRFALEDANRDRRVDLSDAVSQVRHLVETAWNEDLGALDLHKAVLAVSATAGLETVVQPGTDPYETGRLSMTALCLLSAFQWDRPISAGLVRPEPTVRFESLPRGPAAPPPEST